MDFDNFLTEDCEEHLQDDLYGFSRTEDCEGSAED
jgi:hypothetical protein